ncbi:FAD-dependent oxidoreductase [Actinomadura sp. 9N407]|uniref:FAD-dependent oxidoreductase n=1 Tax=Actinomadura sp. 9N407 TaxID=3375154 RepID=UPI0037A5FEF2
MPPNTRRVLIVGGGLSGNGLTVLLRRAGIEVDLVEIRPDWNVVSGSGITLQGNALRVLREIGVWDDVEAHGYGFGSLGLIAPDGTVLHAMEDLPTGGDDLPATAGMRRPDLQRAMADAVRASGPPARLGVTVESIDEASGEVAFSDGTSGRYDLIVAADGVHSAVREMIGVPDRPVPTGMGIWRTTAPRPDEVTRTDLAYGGPCYIAGYCPTSETTLYAYLVEPNRDRSALDPASYADEMRGLAEGYGGAWKQIRESITDPAQVNYTWFTQLLVEGPWHSGRVVLAGDSAHACPPTLAQGAAMSLEDVLVLAELLTTRDTWDDALLTEYRDRRMPRVRMVVDASVQLGQWLMDGDRDADVGGLMGRTMGVLRELP